ncbi:MAG: hypothetical protein GX683_04790 [Ruminococcaceae bacterium]|nr:hypothetical protein [Oscillospiraceae bacterium]
MAVVLIAVIYLYISPYCKYVIQGNSRPADAVESFKDDWYLIGGFSGEAGEEFSFLKQNNRNLSTDIKGYFINDTIYCFVPQNTNVSRLRASFTFDGKVSVDNKLQISGLSSLIFTDTVVYSVKNGPTTKNYSVIILKSELPTLQIDTYDEERVLAKVRYVGGTLRLYDTESGYAQQVLPVEIRVRGNSTASLPKLPYKFKLDSAKSLSGLTPSTDYTLLANYYDPTMTRNTLAFAIAEHLGMDFVPESHMVDVIINGEYCGVYCLTTQVDVSSASVDITPITESDTSGEALTGGYLLELETRIYDDMTNAFFTSSTIPVRIKSPSLPTKEQTEYIQNYLNEFESCLYSEDFTYNGKSLEEYIDFESFAAMYWTNEIMKNTDFPVPMSYFVYKDRGGVLSAGPVWDFDIAAGNIMERPDAMDPTQWLSTDTTWYGRLLENEDFNRCVRDMYYENKAWITALPQYTDELISSVEPVQNNNFIRTYIGLNERLFSTEDNDFYKDVSFLEEYLTLRLEWIAQNVDDLENRVVTTE